MSPSCPNCDSGNFKDGSRTRVVRAGYFRRKSDSRMVQRFRCVACGKHFSNATFNACVHQKKRHFNNRLMKLLVSGVSQRRAARILNLSRTTVVRKFQFLARQAEDLLADSNKGFARALIVEFDDLESFEHSKMKPLSITLAVESGSRRILGFEVSSMPAKGLLAKRSRKKYGPRLDGRKEARRLLFNRIKPLISPEALIKSDENPHYPADVREHFPLSLHEVHKGQRGSIVGQGELKKIRFDPLFSLNHTCAMFRANVNRLFRKTWCTTKKPERLAAHLAIYAAFHNVSLLSGP